MRELIRTFLEGNGNGIITSAEARNLGCSPEVVRGMVRSKELVRVARGVYVSAARLNPPGGRSAGDDAFALADRRHLLLLDALLRTYGPKVAASHQSAVLAWGLPAASSSLDRRHLVHTARGRTARRHDDFTIHTCELDGVITEHEGRRLVIPPLAVVSQALQVGLVDAVASMDAAVVRELTTLQEIAEMLERMRHTPLLGLARRAFGLADGLSESPGETRLRLVIIQLGLRFRAQHWIRTETGTFYRVDFYLPELGVVLEYDGREKYLRPENRLNRTGVEAAQNSAAGRKALMAEKSREDDLRIDGFGVGRVTASGLRPEQVSRIITKAGQQAQPRALHRKAEPPAWARR
ncbi:type IV toxin-antitoxin system AbiEi family antitoxin domain-containing protein [Ornithinimicrobium cavernae]|uniref:type IV toxin-antitoxin system AbiEi family antitoxin domain-containing protein n=1 Tax=Ornithinimicrobium cavernae TaxID=2666047 RepID=UPI000D69ADBC|nr:type IV toxin-antitoxin system AbiEi family antitoxin domain-containing protein [Ornithinimicrobium cavernae]